MASELNTIEFICDQILGCGAIRYRKMFGEYMIYLDNKPIFLVCDDNLYVKRLPETTLLLGENAATGYPYDGAKLYYIIDFLDDRERMQELALLLKSLIPIPRK